MQGLFLPDLLGFGGVSIQIEIQQKQPRIW
jgi:hypothetical protein